MLERQIQQAICDYLRWNYPKVIFTCEQGGLYTTPGVAKRIQSQRSSNGLPDLIILEPRRIFYGLCIEIKRSASGVYKKNGSLRKSTHIEAQNAVLTNLRLRGYFATFGCGFDECKEIIDNYLR